MRDRVPQGNPAKHESFPAYPLGADGPCYGYACGCMPHCVAAPGGPNRCDAALKLLQQTEALMTTEAKASWRWRLLHHRGVIDAGLFRANGSAPGADVAAAMADIAAIYHMECPGPSAVCNCTGAPRSATCPGPCLKPLTPAQVTCKN